jgi:bifunctional non-homologous end joining protein LigD
LQVYVPINSPVTYDKTKAFSHAVAELLEAQSPETVVSNMQKNRRPGKVLVDWSQNDEHKTTVNVYSLRAKDYPSVSTPVTWDEVESVVRTRNATTLQFVSKEVLKRVEKLGDLFAPVLSLKQKLPALRVMQNLRNQ